MTTEAPTEVTAARRTVEIIEALDRLESAGVTRIAEELDVAKSTAHDYLNTLEAEEYVCKRGTEYTLSLRVLGHGIRTRNRMDLYRVGREIIDELADSTEEFVTMVVPEHGWGVNIYHNQGGRTVRFDTYLGKREYPHCSSWGKAILAEWSDERIRTVVERRGMPQRTDNTITDVETLLEEIETIRERGYAIDREEGTAGTTCVGGAITSSDDTVLGAVSISGASRRFDEERIGQLSQELLEAINIIEINLQTVPQR